MRVHDTNRKKAFQSLKQSGSRLCSNYKPSPNNEVQVGKIHEEKSNYGVVTNVAWVPPVFASECQIHQQSKVSFSSCCMICEQRQLSFKSHTEPQRLHV